MRAYIPHMCKLSIFVYDSKMSDSDSMHGQEPAYDT
jgi:hypothetical protein